MMKKKDELEVKFSLIVRFIFSIIVILGTYSIIMDFISYESFKDFYHNDGIKWTFALCVIWPVLIVIYNYGVLIDKNGIQRLLIRAKQGVNLEEFSFFVDRQYYFTVVSG